MKRYLTIIAIFFFVITICNGQIRGHKWGESTKEAEKIEKRTSDSFFFIGPDINGYDYNSVRVAGFYGNLQLLFSLTKYRGLYSIIFIVEGDVYSDLKKALIYKYGKSSSSFGKREIWKLNKHDITLEYSKDSKKETKLVYTSRKWIEQEEMLKTTQGRAEEL